MLLAHSKDLVTVLTHPATPSPTPSRPPRMNSKREGLSDIRLLIQSELEGVGTALIPVSAVVVIRMDSGFAVFYCLTPVRHCEFCELVW